MNTSELPNQAPLIVRSVRSAQGIEALKPEWKAVDQVNSNGNPFTSYDWISNWHHTFGKELRGPFRQIPHFLTFRTAEGQLIAVTPLMRESIGYGATGIHRLVNAGYTPKFNMTEMPGSAVSSGWEEAHAKALAARIEWERARFYKIYLSGVETGTPVSVTLSSKAQAQGWITGENYSVFKLSLNRGFDKVLAAASGNLRGNIRKSARSLEPHSVQHEMITDPADMPAAIDTLLDLHTARSLTNEITTSSDAKEVKGHNNYMPSPEHRSFLRRAAADLTREGNFMISQLRVDGEVAASLALLRSNRSIYRYYSGFDTKWWEHRVMLNLTVRTFEKLTEMPDIDEINLSAGEDPTKTTWRPLKQPTEFYGIETTNPVINRLQKFAQSFRDRIRNLS